MKPEERRREIVKAARELFLKNEYEKNTIRNAMDKAADSKGTTYHYFKLKEQLIDIVAFDLVDDYMAMLEKRLKGAQGNALEKMRALVAPGKVTSNKENILDRLHRPGNARLHIHLLAAAISWLAPLYANLIEQDCREGLFHCEHPLETVGFLLAAA